MNELVFFEKNFANQKFEVYPVTGDLQAVLRGIGKIMIFFQIHTLFSIYYASKSTYEVKDPVTPKTSIPAHERKKRNANGKDSIALPDE